MRTNGDLRYSKAPLDGVSILSCQGEHHFSKHLHDGYVIWLNSGAGEHYSLQGATHILRPGSISIIEPGVIHANHSGEHPLSHLRSFYLSEAWVCDLHRTITQQEQKQFLTTTEIRQKDLWHKLVMLHEKLLITDEKMEIECSMLTVFAEIFMRMGYSAKLPSLSAGTRIAKAREYMSAHLDENISLDDLAREVGCSVFYLIRLFRKQMQMTPHAYLVQLRLEKARDYLDRGMSIVDAALLSGFTDQCHLTRRFKLRYGLTPGRYLSQSNR